MKKSLAVACLSALMMFVCSADLKAAPIPSNGYPTAEAAAEAFIKAFAYKNIDIFWSLGAPSNKTQMIQEAGSEKAAKAELRKKMLSDDDTEAMSAKMQQILTNPAMKDRVVSNLKELTIRVNGRYYFDFIKMGQKK